MTHLSDLQAEYFSNLFSVTNQLAYRKMNEGTVFENPSFYMKNHVLISQFKNPFKIIVIVVKENPF